MKHFEKRKTAYNKKGFVGCVAPTMKLIVVTFNVEVHCLSQFCDSEFVTMIVVTGMGVTKYEWQKIKD